MIEVNGITGVNTFNIEQGTDEWLEHRVGVITASKASLVLMDSITPPMPKDVEIVPSGKRGVNDVEFEGERFQGTKSDCEKWVRSKLKPQMPDGQKTYMLELIAQIVTGVVPESVSFKQAEWGHLNEPLARDAFEAKEFCIVTEAGLIYKDEFLRCAISPDGLLMDEKHGLEIKSPFTSQVHLDSVLFGKIKPEYIAQCQFSMWVTGWDKWNFVSYDNRMRGKSQNRLHTVVIERDESIMAEFDKKVPLFISEMDKHLEKLGFKFGDQWSKK